jgi:hypothetical protein
VREMNLSILEERLSAYGSQGYYLLEAFVLQLLRVEAEANGQTVHAEERSPHSTMDAFAPAGLAEITGPVSIEVASALSHRILETIVRSYLKYRKSERESLLIIALRYSTGSSDDFINHLAQRAATKIYIWGPSRIQELIDKHPEAANDLADRLFSLRLQMAVSRNPDDWEAKREEIISEVAEYYRSGRFSLFLGAGVSSSAGLPDWDTLLNSLFVSMLTDEGRKERRSEDGYVASIVKRLREIDGPSALTLARYIRKGLSAGSALEQNQFIGAVTKQLYELRDHRRSLSSTLIKEIVNLCTPTRVGAKVRSVLTYNFDDLLERELESRSLSFKSIFEELDLAGSEELPVYHVHGFLPEDRSKYPSLNRSTLVFSEEGYHRIYSEAYHWSNLIQLTSLKETACLMVGLSVTDPNLRRLLEIASKSTVKPKHFAFLKRIDLEEFMKIDDKKVVRAPNEVTRRFLDKHHSLNEEVMRELGIKVIWYKSYEDIPVLLQKIGKAH